jgi:hypothetical protein
VGYDPNEPRDDHGRWGAGGSAAAAAIAGASAKTQAAVAWVKSGAAQQALRGAITEDRVKTAITMGITSALYHIGQLDDPAMAVVEPFLHNQVHNVAGNLQVASGRARDLMIAGVRALIDAKISGTK